MPYEAERPRGTTGSANEGEREPHRREEGPRIVKLKPELVVRQSA
jgi:hypothetical protein